MNDESLRPIERRVLAMVDDGVAVDDIAARLKRSPAYVRRMIRWARTPRTGPASRRLSDALERRVLALRRRGESHEEIGRRLGRSARSVRQVEGFAHFKQARDTAVFKRALDLLAQAGREARSEPSLPHPDVTSKEAS